MPRLVQIQHPERGRRVAIVEEPSLHIVADFGSIYEAAQAAIRAGKRLADVLRPTAEAIDYSETYAGRSDWKLLPAFDHPAEPARCFVMGTGLTHKASAAMRQAMHGKPQDETDSMKMYRLGLEGGRPTEGCIGASPEWFYKGTGDALRAHGEALDVPSHGSDGGEEAEIAGCYVIGSDRVPYRVGLVQGNEFSDHVLESTNYLNLAQSKLRACSIGPELVVGADFSEVLGRTRILRNEKIVWEGKLASGEKWMCHSLANLEHHHFKHAAHCRAGDAHVHFLGADEFSFKDRLVLQDGDVMSVEFEAFGRPLRNPIRLDRSKQPLVAVKVL
jgi:hypothetical protein